MKTAELQVTLLLLGFEPVNYNVHDETITYTHLVHKGSVYVNAKDKTIFVAVHADASVIEFNDQEIPIQQRLLEAMHYDKLR